MASSCVWSQPRPKQLGAIGAGAFISYVCSWCQQGQLGSVENCLRWLEGILAAFLKKKKKKSKVEFVT